jgi:hypothetical protein
MEDYFLSEGSLPGSPDADIANTIWGETDYAGRKVREWYKVKQFIAFIERINENNKHNYDRSPEVDNTGTSGPYHASPPENDPDGGVRPDADGRLIFSEARSWYMNGNGQSLLININSIDLSKVSVSDFDRVGQYKQFNLAGDYYSNLNDALVYGTLTLEYLGNNNVMVRNAHDIYDFDIKTWSSDTWIRNVLTMGAMVINGDGNPYIIWIYGQTTLKK